MAPAAGAERPTLIERWIGVLPVPFVWAALIWTVLWTALVPYVSAYLDTGSTQAALSYMFNQNCYSSCDTAQRIGSFVSSGLFFFLPGLMARRMRLIIVRARPGLSSISSAGDQAFSTVFSAMSKALPQLLLSGGTFLAFALLSTAPSGQEGPGLISQSVSPFYYFFSLIALGSFLWTYVVALRGLNKYGGEYLILKPPSEDASQGARPLGSISLSVAGTYFALVAVGLVTLVLTPFDASGILVLGVLTVVGVVMFFLPLNSIHRRMRESKEKELKTVQIELAGLANKATSGSTDSAGAPQRIEKLIGAQILHRQVAAAHTWPFDTSILGRLVAVVLSVAAILISTIVRNFLRL